MTSYFLILVFQEIYSLIQKAPDSFTPVLENEQKLSVHPSTFGGESGTYQLFPHHPSFQGEFFVFISG